MIRTPARLGTALLLVYVAVAVATAAWGPGRLLPIFDGFGSHPGVYNWVKPPKEFAEGNRPPEAGQARIAFGLTGSSPATADTTDGQATASVPAGAVVPQPSANAATIDLRPFDATRLGPLPEGLRPEGNAYEVSVTYLPSGARAATVTTPGLVGVLSEGPSDTLLFSADGRSWRTVEGRPAAGGKGFTAPLTELGYYLAAGHGPPRPFESSRGFPVALMAVAALVPLVLGGLLLSRRRTAGPSPAARPTRSAPPKSKKASRSPVRKPTAKKKSKAGPPPKREAKGQPPEASARKSRPATGGDEAPRKAEER